MPDLKRGVLRRLGESRDMNTNQVKEEIHQLIDQLPEENWQEILEYLQAFQQLNTNQKKRLGLFQQIIQEDANLLKRLAQ